jgi:acetylornithine deacetylase/succinyl-diaminopimelate desuccinylase-like protein
MDKSALTARVDALRPAFVDHLKTLVEIPSVSAQSRHKGDIRRCADAAAGLLRAAGGTAEVRETPGNPVVTGQLGDDPSWPSVVVYNHIDVQPAEEGKDGWTRAPFSFAEEDGRFYGRGSTDDKGPAVTALLAARLAREAGIPLNIRFVWELEEEIGSPSFEAFLGAHGAALEPDSVVVSDTIWLAAGKPAVPYGLRGLAGGLLKLRTAQKDAHSGLAGGAARNPVAELADVVSRCADARTGTILIEGFDQTWQPVSAEEARDFTASGFSVESFKRAHQLDRLRSDDAAEVTQRIWGRPTFEVHGIAGGYQDEGIKTIVPPYAEAKVSMRLVPPQDPEECLRLLAAHVRKLNPDVEVTFEKGLRPYSGQRTGPHAEAAAEALDFGFGARPAYVREGGSIGAVLSMAEAWRAPITLLGLSLPEDGYHGPNESYAWGQGRGGMLTFVRYFERLAALGGRAGQSPVDARGASAGQ